MCKFIGIEDLAANALIELLDASAPMRKVTFRQLIDYGNVVIKILNDESLSAVAIYSKDRTESLIRNYSDFFDVNFDEETISLCEGKTAEDLRIHFRSMLTIDWLLAFRNKLALKVLGIK